MCIAPCGKVEEIYIVVLLRLTTRLVKLFYKLITVCPQAKQFIINNNNNLISEMATPFDNVNILKTCHRYAQWSPSGHKGSECLGKLM